MVRPKKYLGQHFLTDKHIAQKIVQSLELTSPGSVVVEIGPGTGVLTQYLMQQPDINLQLVEIDRESVAFLKEKYPELSDKIWSQDFLALDLTSITRESISIIGNFPYNISSQILFKVLDYHDQVDQVVCMLQKEVADRIVAGPGSKTYGILSVLLQAYYDIKFLFKVPPGVFFPPPKVMSGVIRLTRNNRKELGCDELLFTKVVKQGFQNRRKTLRNALKPLNLPPHILAGNQMDKRAEQLSVEAFIALTREIESDHEGSRSV